MTDSEKLTAERGSAHGKWDRQSWKGNVIKSVFRDSDKWDHLSPSQQEALDMIATKISRILTGNPNETDHWADIEGYAYLARKEIERG